MELLIVTGMSGAGKSRAIVVLEDLGYYCVDNIPVDMLPTFAELCMRGEKRYERAAIVIDIRTLAGNEGDNTHPADRLLSVLDLLKNMGCSYSVMFLDAADDILVRRYNETRRRHPLASDNITTREAVRSERELLTGIREISEYIVDTSESSVSELRDYLVAIFDKERKRSYMLVRVVSFGFKYGVPSESDLLFDSRFLPNPYYIPEYRTLGGNDAKVRSYLESFPETTEFTDKLFSLIDFLVPRFMAGGKTTLVISVGCTGGQHRSVAIAEKIGEHAREAGWRALVTHRDMEKNIREIRHR